MFDEKGDDVMGFGIEDKDWIDPPDEEVECWSCPDWVQCPMDRKWGWCRQCGDFTRDDDGCV